MRRLIVLGAAALGAVVVAVTATAAPNDAKGPDCVDVNQGSFIYNVDGTVTGNVRVDAPACKQATYTLFVLDESGALTTIATDLGEATSVAVPELVFFATGTVTGDTDTDVCVYVETRIGGHIFDRAPDQDCVELIKNGSPGGSGFE